LTDISPDSPSTVPDDPVSHVRWVPIEKVTPNDYNPNAVAKVEMGLLLLSIREDGFTQPVVTYYDEARDLYVIVDGFHRYFVLLHSEDVLTRTGGRCPIVVIEKNLSERMASTVRHNRARGKHSINGMANMVYGMLEEGLTDAEVCNALGLEPEELVRLKHVTGYSKLYADVEYNRAWMTANQIEHRTAHRERQEQEV
jgi:ParB-like chromosome segregation protein Spo0J